MIYLQNPQNFILKKNCFFSLSPKPEIIKFAGNVLLRLHPHDYLEEEDDDDDVRMEVNHENIKIKQRKTLEESINLILEEPTFTHHDERDYQQKSGISHGCGYDDNPSPPTS